MGGTDPIHHGHLVAASEVAGRFSLDEVVFVPTGQPWQKTHREVSSAGGPLFDDRHCYRVQPEVHRQSRRHRSTRPTYTADTLRDLRVERGDDVDMYFITGADALAQILTWHEVDSIFDLAHFVGCTRPGVEFDSPVIAQLPQDKVTLLEIPALAISSSACRLAGAAA